MNVNEKLIQDTKRLLLTRYPRFGSEIASANIEYRTNLKYRTAATDGKNIFFDPDYLASLSEDDRIFLIAHELMHIKFSHAHRLLDKDGKKRDLNTWNEATDAIINANLERDGFKIKEGYINRPEALKYSAEEFYQILLKEKQDQDNKNKDQSGSDDNKDSQSQESNNKDNQQYGDDHSLWEEAFEKQQNNGTEKSENTKSTEQTTPLKEATADKFNEKSEFSENREERKAIAKEQIKQMREQMLKSITNPEESKKINLGDVGESRNPFDWTYFIRKEIEKNETIWSQRRSIAENNYAYRLEEYDIEDEAETEVMIDVSGSVDLDMVKSFLRILKPLLKQSKLRVGCFNENFWGMVEIKSIHDIDNFIIPEDARGHSAWTEDWDLAVRSFTKKREINKIVFTDGIPCPGTMPKEDLKNENILWLVYGNEKFRPCCGKVINLTDDQLQMLNSCQTKTGISARNR